MAGGLCGANNTSTRTRVAVKSPRDAMNFTGIADASVPEFGVAAGVEPAPSQEYLSRGQTAGVFGRNLSALSIKLRHRTPSTHQVLGVVFCELRQPFHQRCRVHVSRIVWSDFPFDQLLFFQACECVLNCAEL
jgi:hypothetical protein